MVKKYDHDKISEQIAKNYNAPYNKGQGPDVKTPNLVIEIEVSKDMFNQGMQQLQGFGKPRYLAVPDDIVSDALERTKNTKVGVMDQKGNIVKRAQAPRPRTKKK